MIKHNKLMKTINKLSIKTKTFLIPSFGFIFLISIILLSFNAYANFVESLRKLKNIDQKVFYLSKEIEKNTQNAHIFLLNTVITKNENLDDIQSVRESIEQALDDIDVLLLTAKNLKIRRLMELLNSLKLKIKTFYKIGKNINKEFEIEYTYGIDAIYGLNNIRKTMQLESDELVYLSKTRLEQSTKELEEIISINKQVILVVGICGVILSFLFAYILIKSINRAIKKLKDGIFEFVSYLEKTNNGQLEALTFKKLSIETDDETGKLTKSFNKMVDSIEYLNSNQKEMLKRLKVVNNKLTESIDYASIIQNSMLPKNQSLNRYFKDYFVIWEPRDTVGGDLYFFEEVEDGCLLFIVDCTGHGVPGAFMTMIVGGLIKHIINRENSKNPAEILKNLNKMVQTSLNQDKSETLSDDGLDAGICYINTKDKKLIFSGAKISLLYVKDSKIEIVKPSKMSLGYKKSDVNYEFINSTVDIENSKFYLKTDGFTDQVGGERGFSFGNSKFKRVLLENCDKSFEKQKSILTKSLAFYQRDFERRDDITIVGFEVK